MPNTLLTYTDYTGKNPRTDLILTGGKRKQTLEKKNQTPLQKPRYHPPPRKQNHSHAHTTNSPTTRKKRHIHRPIQKPKIMVKTK